MRYRHLLASLVVSAVLAGCLGGEADQDAGDGDGPQSGTQNPNGGDQPPSNTTRDGVKPTVWFMDDCHGFELTQNYPTALHPAPVPPGYHEPPAEAPLQFTGINAFACERIGLGDLERPATVILLVASNALPPENCMEGAGPRGTLYVHRVWTNDTGIAEVLVRMGLTVVESEIHGRQGALPYAESWTWLDGEYALDFATTGEPSTGIEASVRWAWLSNGTTNYVDMRYDFDTTGLRTVATGIAPDVYVDPAEPGAWSAPLLSDITARGAVRYFDSLDCS